ncbi:hypothetical protein V1505DRAFT_395737 [Lipomyces doorenjongii]
MSQKSVHVGEYHSIPDDSSPGLVFLKKFLPVLDSLDENTSIGDFVLPETRFIVGDNVTNADSLATMFRIRRFTGAFGSSGWLQQRQTYAVSITKFQDDPQQLPVQVPEFNVIELEPSASDSGKFVAVELRSYLDPSHTPP